ncbi:carboxypeptidase M32 [Reinekea marinisedimentorum]|uniref:Metal-dependent carboxypeptidase n=1 Tax=Reinekea marinisedimentorum TaxID=230495 RepID=A0A4R3IDR7_9GAMM|nr:carboxypeptidase M32 [Reinekea marinisedimentorum]TCS43718.1 carboxypeptidase Taq [Reinekea marinisedimentorum]
MSYASLEETFYRLAQLEHANAILGWDQQVMMPAKGNEARGKALAELAVMRAEILQAPQLADSFAAAGQALSNLEPWQQANFHEMKTTWQRASALPTELIEQEAMTLNECEHAWRTLRAENDWQSFEPMLQKVFDITRTKAQALYEKLGAENGYDNPYDALLDTFDPGSRMRTIDPVFRELKSELPGLLQQVLEKQNTATPALMQSQPISAEQQKPLAKALMAVLGYDFNGGRLDEAAHPFSGGVPDDSRITTRYDEANVINGLMAVIHETGHASYEMNLPKEWRYKPVGNSMGMTVHESQSLFFEMQLGHSQAFVEALVPMLEQHLSPQPVFAADNILKLVNKVEPGLIRVYADEVTYPLHVILRYELERDLILGNAKVSDIPERWNAAMQGYLGLNTEGDYKNGPMQDVHWPSGAIGYFPSYTLGAMTAAQLFAAMNKAIPDVQQQIAALNFQPVFNWLSENIWQKGRSLSYHQLLTEATGESLNSQFFLNHIRSRYLG